MIIFESTVTTSEASSIFWGSWGRSKNWFELKIEPPQANLACLNRWNTLFKVEDRINKIFLICTSIKVTSCVFTIRLCFNEGVQNTITQFFGPFKTTFICGYLLVLCSSLGLFSVLLRPLQKFVCADLLNRGFNFEWWSNFMAIFCF